MNKLFEIPELRQRYLAHFRTILEESFDSEYINELIDNYGEFINQSVYEDPQKIYSYNEFLNAINSLKNYFSNRENYLYSNNEIIQCLN